MRLTSFAFAAIFLLGAAVQWNDPDPALWILAYLSGAGLSLAAALGRRLFWLDALAALVFAIAFGALASSLLDAPSEAFTSFRMQSVSHEEPREAVGLALLSIWCGVLAYRAWSANASRGAQSADQTAAGARSDGG